MADNWKNPVVRTIVRSKIKAASKRAGLKIPIKKIGEIEGHLCSKTETREQYMIMAARVILHFQEIEKKRLSQANDVTRLSGPNPEEQEPNQETQEPKCEPDDMESINSAINKLIFN